MLTIRVSSLILCLGAISAVHAQSWTEKISFNGFFQMQYVDDATPGSEKSMFELRRFRINMDGAPARGIDFRASLNIGSGTSPVIKDAWLGYRPEGSNVKFTLGRFSAPLGHDIPTPDLGREFPERANYNAIYFPGERIQGVMAGITASKAVRVNLGAVNALTAEDVEETGRPSGSRSGIAGFGGVRYSQNGVDAGLSYFAGRRTERTSGGPTSPAVDRRFLYLDAGYAFSGIPIKIWGELMDGHDRRSATTSSSTNVGKDVRGLQLVGSYSLDKRNTLSVRTIEFDPDQDVDGNLIRQTGISWAHRLDNGLQFSASYEVVTDPSKTPKRFNIVTVRAQYKF